MKAVWPKVHWERTIAPLEAFRYCKKEDKDAWTLDNRHQGARTDLAELVEAMHAGECTRDLWRDHTATMIRFHKGVEAGIAALRLKPTVPRFQDFRWDEITDWSKSHIIVGETGIGKTEYAKRHFPGGCLMISRVDELKKFDPTVHEGIVFDDMEFMRLTREEQIHLVDIDEDRTIGNRYVDAFIPAGTKKIFTCNRLPIFSDFPEINRRVEVHKLTACS